MKASSLVSAASVCFGLTLWSLAHAAPPVETQDDEAVQVQEVRQAAPVPPAPVQAVPPPAVVAPASAVAPSQPAPPTRALPPGVPPGSTTGPMYFNGPVYIVPAYPVGQPAAPPVLVAPPVAPVQMVTPRPSVPSVPQGRRPVPVSPQRLALGAHFSSLWVNQRLFNSDLLMMGAGGTLRYRVYGSFTLEASVDVVGKSFHDGAYARTAVPIQAAALFYLMPPKRQIHFNVYALAGGGIMPGKLTLNDRQNPERTLSTNEALFQGGVGCEMRFSRIAFTADARAIGLWRLGDAKEYDAFQMEEANGLNLRQPAIAEKAYGWIFNVGALLWF